MCYLCALKIGNASKGVSVDKLSLVLVAVFAFTFFGANVRRSRSGPVLRWWLVVFCYSRSFLRDGDTVVMHRMDGLVGPQSG